MKKGFTLAEIMIALVVIGVITSILLPVAFNNIPNENVMKFKKGNATLAKVINELVTSGEYYTPGDLGIKADGTIVDGKHDGDITYFCKTFADIVATKNINCAATSDSIYEGFIHLSTDGSDNMLNYNGRVDKLFGGNPNIKNALDTICSNSKMNAEIKTSDNISFYQSEPTCTFGIKRIDEKFYVPPVGSPEDNIRLFGGYQEQDDGFDLIYKVFCMDIDGINQGEAPFGYGIRVDGKIILGARAQEWLEKSIQEK